MAQHNVNSRIILLNDTKANWDSKADKFVLLKGEIGIETDTKKFKVGDGVSTWAELDYAVGGSGSGSTTSPDAELSETSENAVQNKVVTAELNKKSNTDSVNTKMLGVPSNSNWIDIGWSGDTTLYKAPANGYIVAYFQATSNANAFKGVRLYNVGNNEFPSDDILSSVIKGGNTCFIYHGISAGDFITSIPVKKGDNIKIGWQNVTRDALRFIPSEEV